MQAYSNPKRESDPHALPDVEVFYMTANEALEHFGDDTEDGLPGPELAGWYWWTCFPGCLPDSEPVGPFATEDEALADAQQDANDYIDIDDGGVEDVEVP